MSAEWAADAKSIGTIAEVMRMLAHPTRLRLLGMLRSGKRNVTSLCDELGQAQPTISHHIGMLREGGLLVAQRNWREHYYSLNPEHFSTAHEGRSLQLSYGAIRLDLG